jgi:hypothetical protein
MIKVIIPACGESTRFPNTRPKWLLTNPSGKAMVVDSLSGIDLSNVDKVYVTILKKHIENIVDTSKLIKQFNSNLVEFVILNSGTKSQVETVAETIKIKNINDPIYIKDADNYFIDTVLDGNYVSTFKISGKIVAQNKSYVKKNSMGNIINIAEKSIISDEFCCGGYSFSNSSLFLDLYNKYKYPCISNIIYDSIINNLAIFHTHNVTNYLDWGTIDEWKLFKNEYETIFIDLDGVLVKNSGEYILPLWGDTNILQKNVKLVNGMYDSGKKFIIITTSRKNENNVINYINSVGIKFHKIITDLPCCRRTIINDFSNTNMYPSCTAINIERDNDNLELLF